MFFKRGIVILMKKFNFAEQIVTLNKNWKSVKGALRKSVSVYLNGNFIVFGEILFYNKNR